MNGLVTALVIFVRNMKYPGRHITSGRIDGLKDISTKLSTQYQDQTNKRNRRNNSRFTIKGFWNCGLD
jgi:hypothetical protein